MGLTEQEKNAMVQLFAFLLRRMPVIMASMDEEKLKEIPEIEEYIQSLRQVPE